MKSVLPPAFIESRWTLMKEIACLLVQSAADETDAQLAAMQRADAERYHNWCEAVCTEWLVID